jgi:hypothetical protein
VRLLRNPAGKQAVAHGLTDGGDRRALDDYVRHGTTSLFAALDVKSGGSSGSSWTRSTPPCRPGLTCI